MNTPECNINWSERDDFFLNPDGEYILLADKDGSYSLITVRLDGTGDGLTAWDTWSGKRFEPSEFTRLAIVAFTLNQPSQLTALTK